MNNTCSYSTVIKVNLYFKHNIRIFFSFIIYYKNILSYVIKMFFYSTVKNMLKTFLWHFHNIFEVFIYLICPSFFLFKSVLPREKNKYMKKKKTKCETIKSVRNLLWTYAHCARSSTCSSLRFKVRCFRCKR